MIYRAADITPQSRRALAKMVDSRGPEPLRDMLREILEHLQDGRDVEIVAAAPESPAERLEYLRGELRAERMSYGDLVELASLAEHIDPGDVELLEPAGVPEFPQEGCKDCAAGHPVSHTHAED